MHLRLSGEGSLIFNRSSSADDLGSLHISIDSVSTDDATGLYSEGKRVFSNLELVVLALLEVDSVLCRLASGCHGSIGLSFDGSLLIHLSSSLDGANILVD